MRASGALERRQAADGTNRSTHAVAVLWRVCASTDLGRQASGVAVELRAAALRGSVQEQSGRCASSSMRSRWRAQRSRRRASEGGGEGARSSNGGVRKAALPFAHTLVDRPENLLHSCISIDIDCFPLVMLLMLLVEPLDVEKRCEPARSRRSRWTRSAGRQLRLRQGCSAVLVLHCDPRRRWRTQRRGERRWRSEHSSEVSGSDSRRAVPVALLWPARARPSRS